LRRCIDQGLVGGQSFAVDASLIKADANRQNGIEGEKDCPRSCGITVLPEPLKPSPASFGSRTFSTESAFRHGVRVTSDAVHWGKADMILKRQHFRL